MKVFNSLTVPNMEIMPLLRRKLFWFFDWLKGGTVQDHLYDIKTILEEFNSTESLIRRENHLKNLIQHAKETVPFYRDNVKGDDLEHFPVINKDTVRENYEAFRSSNFTNDKEIKLVMTSGSTGAPFKVYHNINKRMRNSADMIYFMGRAGYELGKKILFMKVWNDINKKSLWTRFKENIVPYNVFNYTDSDIAKLILDIENDSSEKNLVCFASTCKVIVDYMRNKGIKPKNYNIKSIITNSDALDNSVKDQMEYYFRAPTIARYSNIEGGMLAQQMPSQGYKYDVNLASFYIEILKMDEDEPATFGEIGRVVITDLFNYAMPLIRYYTGDLARWSDKTNEYGAPRLEGIVGRSDELIRAADNKIVTSYVIAANTWKYTEIRQFQFIQTDVGTYTFRLNPWRLPFKEEKNLIKEFKGYLGENAKINIEYVDEIPLLDSGKRKLVINKLKTKCPSHANSKTFSI